MEQQKAIKRQITKFSFYGFLKNLKFFEPYLIVYFALSGLSLFEIGLLYSIREILIYIFEVPSGVLADRYGKKTELIICFIFYIISFVLFYVGASFLLYAIAMVFFGLGEAFRSGTHKAMIMSYIDHQNITDSKSKIYGKTRSFSLIGSTVSSLISIIFVLVLPNLSLLFIIAIIPYVLDMILILTYPNYLNDRVDSTFKLKEFLRQNVIAIKFIFEEKKIRKLLMSSASYNAVFKTIKDYIQPIIITITISIIVFQNLSVEQNTNVYLGVIYAVIYLISSVASFNSHKLMEYISREKIIGLIWFLSGMTLVLLSIFIENLIILVVLFILLYVFLNLRKPIMIEKIGDEVENSKRASALSIESQFTSILVAIFAPILGLIADHYSISVMLMIVGLIMVMIYIIKTNFILRERGVQ
ncbi:MAG: MFS transporter [Bacilli bacterium]|nr:MFS transporter [Bacilli bacterium]